MIPATLLAPLTLAVVLGVSAVAKLRDPASVDEGFRNLRVPAALNRAWLRRLVPWLELLIALGLLVGVWPVGVLAAVAALALFAVYTVLIVRAWRAPEAADCRCFGSLASGRVTGWTVVRNAVLLLLSAVAIADAAGPSPLAMRLADPDVVGWLVGAALVALLVFAVVREPDTSPAAAAGATTAATSEPVASEEGDELEFVRLPIPFSRLTTASGDTVTLRELARWRPQLLVYVSSTCASCEPVIEALPGWREAMPEVDVRPVVWSGGSLPDSLADFADQLLTDNENAMEVLELYGTPGAVLFGADGLIAGGPVAGGDAVVQLAQDMIEQLAEARQGYAAASEEEDDLSRR